MLVAQLSKSPSTEFTTDTSVISDENKVDWLMQESVFSHLSAEEKECITNVPSAKNLDDLRMFARYALLSFGATSAQLLVFFLWL